MINWIRPPNKMEYSSKSAAHLREGWALTIQGVVSGVLGFRFPVSGFGFGQRKAGVMPENADRLRWALRVQDLRVLGSWLLVWGFGVRV